MLIVVAEKGREEAAAAEVEEAKEEAEGRK